jgi:hypothetical protein
MVTFVAREMIFLNDRRDVLRLPVDLQLNVDGKHTVNGAKVAVQFPQDKHVPQGSYPGSMFIDGALTIINVMVGSAALRLVVEEVPPFG